MKKKNINTLLSIICLMFIFLIFFSTKDNAIEINSDDGEVTNYTNIEIESNDEIKNNDILKNPINNVKKIKVFFNNKTRSIREPLILYDESLSISKNEVVIIVNNNSDISKEIGYYYADKRNISYENICLIETSTSEVINRNTYNDIEDQVKTFMSENNLIESIKYLVTTKQVPLKVSGTSDYFSGNCSSLDSEIALIFSPMESGNDGKYNNPYFNENNHFERNNNDGIYLVNRLTGKNVNDAKALVDRAISAENNISGKCYFDADSAMTDGYKGYDDNINESFYYVNDNYDFDCGLEESSKDIGLDGAKYNIYSSKNLTSANETATDAMLYWGWYSNSSYYDSFNWSVGAVGQRLHSVNAASFNSNHWCSGAISDGITGTMGNVYEPWLDAAHYPTIFFERILDGYNFAEASYMSQPYLSWQSVVIGDPLYTPYRLDINLSSNDNAHYVEPNNSTNFTINVRNDGNLRNEIELGVSNVSNQWTAKFNRTSIILEKGESVNITLIVTVPQNVKKGIYEIIATATSKNDNTKTSRISIFTTVYHVLEHINVTPEIWNMNADEVIQFNASGYDEEWNEILINPVWFTDGGGILNETGFFNATTTGTWKIYANLFTVSGNTTINISPGKPTHIDVSPTNIILKTDDEGFFIAIAKDSDGNKWNVTEDSEWSLTDPKGTITNGHYNPGKPGNWTITSTLDSINGYSNITIEIGDLKYINVEPNNVIITTDDTFQFSAKGYDSDGNLQLFSPVWSITGGGKIDQNGVFTANRTGNYLVKAYYSGVQGIANITINEGDVKLIDIFPKMNIVKIGDSIQFNAFCYDSDNNLVNVFPIWNNDRGGIIDIYGNFTAITPGNWTIYANYSDISSQINVTILQSHDPPIQDNIPPEIISTNPKDKSENIPIDTQISITFSEQMDFQSLELAITIFPKITFTLQNKSNENTSFLIISSDFEYNTIYSINISSHAKDLVGNQLQSKFTFSFQTELLGGIAGKIFDEKGNPLKGALIIIEGSTFNTLSNFEGIYQIENIPKGNYILNFKIENISQDQSIIITPGNITIVPDLELKGYIQDEYDTKRDNNKIFLWILTIILVITLFVIFILIRKSKN